MQPYIFPYIGYFHLIEASSIFVFYDDVLLIKRGWVNRNRILRNGTAHTFTVPLSKSSQNKRICDTYPAIDKRWKEKFYKLLFYSYKKAPYYGRVMGLISSVFEKEYTNISEMAVESIIAVYGYLERSFDYIESSDCYSFVESKDRADRIIKITKDLGYRAYVNACGGKKIYSKEYFSANEVKLAFVKSNAIVYKQTNKEFIPWLSIIDILMFNDRETTIRFLESYQLD